MDLGAFSVSLPVKDLGKSQSFYETLGFKVFAGSLDANYLIMKNESTLIGLFSGMFDAIMMTFNPGWDQSAQNVESFTDIRDIHAALEASGVGVTKIENEGPTSFIVSDPDGNTILFDQHR